MATSWSVWHCRLFIMPLVLTKPGAYTLEEKRSKFLSYCETVTSEEQARQVLEKIRAEHKAASHHVYAYALRCNTIRFSDDGEPQGTAGMPVLAVFQKNNIIDFVCVVTRYFGGTLLGTGGLARAYTKAAKGALEAAKPEEWHPSKLYRVSCGYSQLDKLKYQFNKWGLEIQEIHYTDHCEAQVRVRDDLAEPFLQGSFYSIHK